MIRGRRDPVHALSQWVSSVLGWRNVTPYVVPNQDVCSVSFVWVINKESLAERERPETGDASLKMGGGQGGTANNTLNSA